MPIQSGRKRAMRSTAPPGRNGQKAVYYPESDGKPMGETPVHRDEIMRLIQTLQHAYADRDDAYVSGNMMFYYEEGNPRASISPDVQVTFGVPKLPERRVYKLWEERVPAVVIEVTSRSTRRGDQTRKHELYARLGIPEYYRYDPLGEYRPALEGYRLTGGAYQRIDPNEAGALPSDELGMRLVLEGARLRFLDSRTAAPFLSPAERAEAAERRVAELERLLRERPGPP